MAVQVTFTVKSLFITFAQAYIKQQILSFNQYLILSLTSELNLFLIREAQHTTKVIVELIK